MQLFKHRGFQVLLIVCLYFSIAHLLPPLIHQGLYTLALLIKDLLMWIMPITVGCFIAHAIGTFRHQALLFIFTLVMFEAISNLSSVWYAFWAGHIAAGHLPSIEIVSSHEDTFTALYRLPLIKPAWWSADKGALVGLILGCFAFINKVKQVIDRGKEIAQWVLTNLFSRLIPVFVLGFVARMFQTQLLQKLTTQYGSLLIWMILFLIIYLLALFFIGNNFSPKRSLNAIKNLLPAAGVAFTSGCSISTMPWTIEGAGKNLRNPSLAKGIIPATTNVQQIGDCIINTFLCFLIYRCFYGVNPDIITWTLFSAVFVLARFTTAAILGGAIFIMLPIYETYLSFNAEMIAIILAFNVILDPIVTCCNVVANGALCHIFETVWNFVLKIKMPLLQKNKRGV